MRYAPLVCILRAHVRFSGSQRMLQARLPHVVTLAQDHGHSCFPQSVRRRFPPTSLSAVSQHGKSLAVRFPLLHQRLCEPQKEIES
jgi:hypothetical protein